MIDARDMNELILGLRQRGMVNMYTNRNEDGSFTIRMAYNSLHEAMQQATIHGINDLDVLENAFDFLVENGLPVE